MGNRRKSLMWILAGVIVGFLALSILGGQALAQESTPQQPVSISSNMGSAHFSLNWNALGAGGGMISSAHFTVNSTIGQPTVGTTTSTHYEVCSGYWCWLERIATIFLPLVLNN